MEPRAAPADAGASSAPAPVVPSALCDLVTVWASLLSRRPRAWAAGFALVAVAAAVGDAPGAEVLAAAAAAVVAHRLPLSTPRMVTRAVLGFALVVAFAAIAAGADLYRTRPSMGLPVVALEGAAVFLLVRFRVPITPPIGLAGAVACGVLAALVDPGLRCAPFAALAILVAGLSARGFVVPALCAGGFGLLAPVLGMVDDPERALWLVHAFVTSVSMWSALALLVRAAAIGDPSAESADKASARLVIRLRRRPWTTALVGCIAGTLFEPARAASLSLASRDVGTMLMFPSMSAAMPFVALLAVGEGGFWAIARFLAAATLSLAVSVGASFLTDRATTFGSAPAWLVVAIAAGPWVYLVVAWSAGRRDSAGPPGRPAAIAGLAALLAIVAGTIFGAVGGLTVEVGGAACFGLAYLIWFVLFHRLSTCGSTGKALAVLWVAVNACSAVAAIATIATGRGMWAGISTAYEGDTAVPSRAACVLGTAAMSVLHGAMCVLAARRARSMCVVPDDHPLIADYGVDRRVLGAPK